MSKLSSQNRSLWNRLILSTKVRLFAVCLLLASVLSGCSTRLVQTETPIIPPQNAIIKAQPFPLFEIPAEAKDTDPAISIDELVEADIELARQCNIIVNRHNELVDYVLKLQQDQAKRLRK